MTLPVSGGSDSCEYLKHITYNPILSQYLRREDTERRELAQVSRGMRGGRLGRPLPDKYNIRRVRKGNFRLRDYKVYFDVVSREQATQLAYRVHRVGKHALGKPLRRAILNSECVHLSFVNLGEIRHVAYSEFEYEGPMPQDWISHNELDQIRRINESIKDNLWKVKLDASFPDKGLLTRMFEQIQSTPAGRKLMTEMDTKVDDQYTVKHVRGRFCVLHIRKEMWIDPDDDPRLSTLHPITSKLETFECNLSTGIFHECMHILLRSLEGKKEKLDLDTDDLEPTLRFDYGDGTYKTSLGPHFPACSGMHEQEVIMGMLDLKGGKVDRTYPIATNDHRYFLGMPLRFGHMGAAEQVKKLEERHYLRSKSPKFMEKHAPLSLLIAVKRENIRAINAMLDDVDPVPFNLMMEQLIDNIADVENIFIFQHVVYRAYAKKLFSQQQIEALLIVLTEEIKKGHDRYIPTLEMMYTMKMIKRVNSEAGRAAVNYVNLNSVAWSQPYVVMRNAFLVQGIEAKRRYTAAKKEPLPLKRVKRKGNQGRGRPRHKFHKL